MISVIGETAIEDDVVDGAGVEGTTKDAGAATAGSPSTARFSLSKEGDFRDALARDDDDGARASGESRGEDDDVVNWPPRGTLAYGRGTDARLLFSGSDSASIWRRKVSLVRLISSGLDDNVQVDNGGNEVSEGR